MTIVEELRKDRESGAKRLIAEYKTGLMTLARRFCVDEGDAEELVNRTFAEVVNGIDGYLEQSAFFGWMCQILTNLHGMEMRRKSRQVETTSSDDVAAALDCEAPERIYDEVDASLLRDAVDKLPKEQRELLVLHYFMDEPIGKIAKILSIPPGTVKSRLHYARVALAAKLGVKVKEAARKPGVKATLLALALCALTALGAAVTAAVYGGAQDKGGRGSEGAATGKTGETSGSGGFSPVAPISTPVPPDSPVPPVVTATTPSNSLTLPLSNSTHEEQTMNTATTLRTLAASAAIAAATASARTVYDAGKALRQNCESGSYANPYTDANGGVWSYYTTSDGEHFTGLSDFPAHSKMENDTMDGWICQSDGNPTHPLLLVNTTGEAVSSYCSSGNQLDADEMMFHPAAYAYAVLRFTVPEDGWYSALATFRDVEQDSNQNGLDGVDVHVTLGSDSDGDTDLATTHVTLEDYSAWNAASKRTRRFDYQMPVRYLRQGMRIQFAVGPNVTGLGGHYSDATGVKVIVVKEDEGSFYDAGVAFTTNVVAGDYVNPYGTAAHGTWHALLSNLGASIADTDFTSWVPQNLENSFDHDLTAQLSLGTDEPNTVRGFNRPAGGPPYVTANVSGIVSGNTSPGELRVLPAGNASQCTVVRFRPPEAGRYSGSVVIRDIADIENAGDDGVEVFLVVADQVVTSAVVRAEAHEVLTARLTFDSTLLTAAEPVDIIVSPRSASNFNDETALSVIFRRDDGAVYDANKSFYAHHVAGNTSVPFDDVLGGGAQWSVGSMTGSWLPNSFATLSGYVYREKTNPDGILSWWERSPDSSGSKYPRIAMTTNAVASCDNSFYITEYPRLAIAANEIFAHPAVPGQNTSCVAVRAIVPSNGIYRIRGRARDLDNTAQNTDGIRFTLALASYIPATKLIQMNNPVPAGVPYEASLEGDRLWLKAGEKVDAVVDPEAANTCDATGLGLCYEYEGDGTASVVNVDFTDSGKLSANTVRAREGFSNWTTWNAISLSGAANATVENCSEADGTTPRNVTIALTRTSGAAITAGSAATGTTLLDSFVTSSGAEDTYTFTISKLKRNEPYTLYLYSANGSSSGNATFTVGGVTKVVDGLWLLGATPMLTRFDVASDANGEISGTFAAADGNGGAFNGLTLVGDIPDYKAPQFTIIIR